MGTEDKLIKKVSKILGEADEQRLLRGENFNIFSVLGIESKENKTHSAFLCELLNPKGSHMLGGIFLSNFLEMLQEKDVNIRLNFDLVGVRNEKNIGSIYSINSLPGHFFIFLNQSSRH